MINNLTGECFLMKNNLLKILLCFCLVVLLSTSTIISINASNVDSESELQSSIYGLVDMGFSPQIPELPVTTETPVAIPERYDPREINGLTPVKNQGNLGLCWCFGSTATFESAVYKYTGLKESYSEEAVRYIDSNEMSGFLGNSNIGLYERNSEDAAHHIVSLSYLTNRNNPCYSNISWISPNRTNQIAYQSISSLNTDKLSLFANSYAANNIADVKYINFDFKNVKKNILEHGGVNIAFCANGDYVNLTNGSFNNLKIEGELIHSIEIIGWDDNYSKLNFSSNCIPQNDGAFLFKNSWGTGWGEDGYGWISYEDVSLNCYNDAYIIDSVDKVSKNEYMLSYDYLPPVGEMNMPLGQNENSVCMANVYDVSTLANSYGSINKITFYTKSIGAFYKIYVVPLNGDNYSMPDMDQLGNIQAMGSVSCEGYITADFSTPYVFNENTDKLAIIVKYTVDRDEVSSIKLAKESFTSDFYLPIANPKESYRYSDGIWRDITNGEISNIGNFCIRPTLVRRMPITQNSTLSSNNLIYSGSDVTVNLNLNGNLLYRITENGNTILFEDNQFTRTEDSVTFKNSYLSSLGVNQYKNIIFEFTDGNSQTLRITRKSNLPHVSIGGKFAVGQTVRAVFDDTDATSGIAYQWQSSPDGTTWADITNATSSTYTIDNSNLLNYLRVKIKSQGNSSYVFPQEKLSSVSTNKVVMYGDVNFDGRINVNDATLIQKYAADLVNFNAEQMVAADVDGDGCISVNDANLINKFSMGLIEVFPVENS